jgi:hypothetical protein
VVDISTSSGFTVNGVGFLSDILPDIQSLTETMYFRHFVILDLLKRKIIAYDCRNSE